MTTYTAVARRSGDGWDVQVIELPDVRCRVEQLDDVADQVTAAIAAALTVEPDTFEVEVNSTVDEDVDAHVAHVADVAHVAAVAAERHPESAARTITTAQQRLAHRLAAMGLSHRDSAYLMNLSHHRVRHLVQSPKPGRQPQPGKPPLAAKAGPEEEETST